MDRYDWEWGRGYAGRRGPPYGRDYGWSGGRWSTEPPGRRPSSGGYSWRDYDRYGVRGPSGYGGGYRFSYPGARSGGRGPYGRQEPWEAGRAVPFEPEIPDDRVRHQAHHVTERRDLELGRLGPWGVGRGGPPHLVPGLADRGARSELREVRTGDQPVVELFDEGIFAGVRPLLRADGTIRLDVEVHH